MTDFTIPSRKIYSISNENIKYKKYRKLCFIYNIRVICPVVFCFTMYVYLRISVHLGHNMCSYIKYVFMFVLTQSLPPQADITLIRRSWALNLWAVLYLSYEITQLVNNSSLIPPAENCYHLPYTGQILIYVTDRWDKVYLPDLSYYIKHELAS
jgi:hypothetical protein